MKKLLAPLLMLGLSVLGGMKGAEILLDYTSSTPKKLHYSLNGVIDPVKARQVSAWLQGLDKEDKAMLHIETYGGHEVSAYKIMEYIGRTKGDVTCYVDSHAMSAGAMILSSCKKIYVTPRAQVLFHLPGYQTDFGRVLAKKGTISYNLLIEAMEQCAFVTKEDIDGVKQGKDITITGKQVMERLSK